MKWQVAQQNSHPPEQQSHFEYKMRSEDDQEIVRRILGYDLEQTGPPGSE